MITELQIQTLMETDLSAVVRTHTAAFPDASLTRLGSETLHRYYAWQLNGPHDAYNIGAFVHDELAGFCFGGVFNGATGGFIRKERSFLIRNVLTHPWLVFNPIFRERLTLGVHILFNNLRPKPKPVSIKATKQPVIRNYGILAIAVDPNLQGKGIGRSLMEQAEAIARQKGFDRMNLSVHPENKQAVNFYEMLEWKKLIEGGDHWLGKMYKTIQDIG